MHIAPYMRAMAGLTNDGSPAAAIMDIVRRPGL
jgi:hypothetical protein